MNILIIEDFALVAALSIIGGVGGYLNGVRQGKFKPSFLNFFTDIFLAITIGLAIAYIGHAQKWNPAIVCALALVLGNNGAESISLLQGIIKSKFGGQNSKGEKSNCDGNKQKDQS